MADTQMMESYLRRGGRGERGPGGAFSDGSGVLGTRKTLSWISSPMSVLRIAPVLRNDVDEAEKVLRTCKCYGAPRGAC